MTDIATKKKKKQLPKVVSLYICLALLIIAIFLGKEIKAGIINGLRLSVMNVVPTLFPFFILSDLWISSIEFNEKGLFARVFSGIFNISPCGLSAFIVGAVCGFPLGVKTAVDLFKQGKINEKELSSLNGYVNNPSAAFVISGIGAGMFGSLSLGIKLYLCTIFSAILTGIMFRPSSEKMNITSVISGQTFSFVESVRSAAYSSINVCAYIIFFSGISALLSTLIKNEILFTLISPFLELTSAGEKIYATRITLGKLTNPLLAFALGFSGFSVHMQVFSFLPKEISKIKYLITKFIQGFLSAIIIVFLT